MNGNLDYGNNPTPFLRVMSDEEIATANAADKQAHQQWLDSTCPCGSPDNRYQLSIDYGDVELKHEACGKPPRWHEWKDCSFSNTVRVTADWKRNCRCNPYITSGHECESELDITIPGKEKDT